MTRLPIYVNCYFNLPGVSGKHTYKIDASNIDVHPYQLFRLERNRWENLSIYASISDAVRVLLKELFSVELTEEINHGQATINPAEILEKIRQGDRIVSIRGAQDGSFRIEYDVNFDELIKRT